MLALTLQDFACPRCKIRPASIVRGRLLPSIGRKKRTFARFVRLCPTVCCVLARKYATARSPATRGLMRGLRRFPFPSFPAQSRLTPYSRNSALRLGKTGGHFLANRYTFQTHIRRQVRNTAIGFLVAAVDC